MGISTNNSNDSLKNWLLIAASTLFLAIVPIWPYGFYTLLRLLVCGIAIFVAYQIRTDQILKTRTAPLIIIAVLFNPLFPIYFIRLIWMPIDIGIGIYLLMLRNKIGEKHGV